MAKKKGLNTKTITIFDLDNGYDFELFVTYEIMDSDIDDEDDSFFNVDGEIDIKSYISSTDEDIPEWITEDMIYNSLIEDLQNEYVDEDSDFDDDNFEEEYNENTDEDW